MANRQIPWRRIADRIGGSFHIQTGATRSSFFLDAEVRGMIVAVRGISIPYSGIGGKTRIRATAERAVDVVFRVRRFGFVRTLFLGDRHGAAEKIEGARLMCAHEEVRTEPESRDRGVTDMRSELTPAGRRGFDRSRRGDSVPIHYNFETRGRAALAYCLGFETNEERLLAAIEATIDLARKPASLLEQWQQLANRLNGRLELSEYWCDDGSTKIVMPFRGHLVIVSPIVDRVGWQRLGLRTRISVLCGCSESHTTLHYVPGEPEIGILRDAIVPLTDAGALVLRREGQQVWADLAGNVTDAARIQAAAMAVTSLVRVNVPAGPYR